MRTINSARNPVWADYAQTEINIEVDFDELDEDFVDFTASPNDLEAHGVTLYNNAVNGDYGVIGAYVAPSNVIGADAMATLRAERNELLVETDYIEMPTKWATLTSSQQTSWATYRNALRDLPADYPNAEKHWNSDYTSCDWINVTWPTKPN